MKQNATEIMFYKSSTYELFFITWNKVLNLFSANIVRTEGDKYVHPSHNWEAMKDHIQVYHSFYI